MDIKQKYREKLNKEPYCQTKAGAYVKSGSYSDDYVKWLEKQLSISRVSSSFSAEDVKWLIMYGYNKDKTIDIRSDEKGELDYAISNMFQMLKDSTHFDAERVKGVFWERVSALANYR